MPLFLSRHADEYHQAPEKSEQQRNEEVFTMSRLMKNGI